MDSIGRQTISAEEAERMRPARWAGERGVEPVIHPNVGELLWMTCDGELHALQVLGRGESGLDQLKGWRFQWITGPRAGEVVDRYSVSFWRPSRPGTGLRHAA